MDWNRSGKFHSPKNQGVSRHADRTERPQTARKRPNYSYSLDIFYERSAAEVRELGLGPGRKRRLQAQGAVRVSPPL